MTGEPLKETELTLGGVPFYELTFEEALPLLPEPYDMERHIQTIGSTREDYYREYTRINRDYRGVETKEFSPSLLIDGQGYATAIGIQQSVDRSTLTGLYYVGQFYDSFICMPTETRGIATKDTAEDVLSKLGFSEEGAKRLAECLHTGVVVIYDSNKNGIKVDCVDYPNIPNVDHDIQWYFDDCRACFTFEDNLLARVFFDVYPL